MVAWTGRRSGNPRKWDGSKRGLVACPTSHAICVSWLAEVAFATHSCEFWLADVAFATHHVNSEWLMWHLQPIHVNSDWLMWHLQPVKVYFNWLSCLLLICLIASEASCYIFTITICVMCIKPYVPREPCWDPSNRRLYEHGIWYNIRHCQESSSQPVPSQVRADSTRPQLTLPTTRLSPGYQTSFNHRPGSTIISFLNHIQP